MDQKDVPGHFDWMHPSEKLFLKSLKFPKRRSDWTLGRFTVKTLLQESILGDLELKDFYILPGEKRAPVLHVPQGVSNARRPSNARGTSITVSISHSHQKTFCITSDNHQNIGCDLELIEDRSPNFLKDYFTKKEHSLFEDLWKKYLDSKTYFTLCWSAKEAVMKATRLGMSLHPKKIQLKNVEIEDAEWNKIEILNLKTDQNYYGYWKENDGMIYVYLSDQVIM